MNKGNLAISAALAGALLWAGASAQTKAQTAPVALGPNPGFEASIATIPGKRCPDLDAFLATDYQLAALFETELKQGMIAEKDAKQFEKYIIGPPVRRYKAAEKEYKARCKDVPVKLNAAKTKLKPSTYLSK